MDNLTRTQMVMLVLLTSFITSMATGIVTVSLMDQAPAPLTQTVHKVIEKITPVNVSQPAATVLAPDGPTREEKVISAIDSVSPAVVSIVASKDLPVIEEYFVSPFEENDFLGMLPEGFLPDVKIPQYQTKGAEMKEISRGTGFFISKDGLLLTNKHVVEDTEATYAVVTNDGKSFAAEVIARDTFQDIAVLKIQLPTNEEGKEIERNFSFVSLGDSDTLKRGQTVIAIGNALGEFTNTVSVGIVSGLNRTITAVGSASGAEQMRELIQTDAAINPDNSGGPLLDLNGKVVGINTAVAQSAENIGFALPINIAKRGVDDAIAYGEIRYPFLGIRYEVTEQGLKLTKGKAGEPAVVVDGPAAKAGLKEGDIIVTLGGEMMTSGNALAFILSKYRVNDEIDAKVLRGEEEIIIKIILEEKPSDL